MPDPLEIERPTERRTSLVLLANEMEAIEFVRDLHDGKYESIPAVLRVYSINDCVELRRRALASATLVA